MAADRPDRGLGTRTSPRVAYIGNFLSGHGINPTYAEELVPQLRANGLDVVAASAELPPARRMLDQLRVIARTPRRDACVVIDLYSGPKAFYAGAAAATACRLLRRRYAVALHGGELPNRVSGSPRLVRWICRGASGVTSPSPYLARHFAAVTDVEVIPNGLDVAAYPSQARSELRPSFVYLRAFERVYGCLELVEAFAIVLKARPDVTLTMIGPDKDGSRRQCEARVGELGITASVRFLPRIPKEEVRRLGDDHDVFVNPTFADNTPVSVIEAMAMGMCIVSTDAGGLRDLLADEETALLVPPGDVDALARAMLRLLDEDTLAARLSANARRAAEAMDWERVLPEWGALLERVSG